LIHHIQRWNPILYEEQWSTREKHKTPKGCCGFFSWDKTCDLCCPLQEKKIVELGDMCQCTGNGNEISCSITKQRHCASDEDCTGKEEVKFGDWSSICVKKEKETTASGSRCAGKKKCDPCGATGNKQCWPFAGTKEPRCLLKGEGGMDCPAEEDPVKDVVEDEPVNPSPIDCTERKKITGKMKFKSKHNMEVWCNCNAKSFEIASADRCGEIEKAAHCTWDEGAALCAPKASTQ